MKSRPIEEAGSATLRGSWPALQRAAQRAREIAARTGTAIVVERDGVIEHIYPGEQSLAPEATKSTPSADSDVQIASREQSKDIASLPDFTQPALLLWQSIPDDVRQRLLANVWCGHCRGETTIIDFSGRINRGNLVLTGKCIRCRHEVARLIEVA